MKRIIIVLYGLMLTALTGFSQERTVENRPYYDLRPFHFGVLVGTHLQDIDFNVAGMQTIVNDDGTTTEALVTCDQDRWDAGFTVGVLGELRLGTYFALRVAPSLYFGARHLTFHNLTNLTADGTPTEAHQDMKTAYMAVPVSITFAAKRFNNHRPYLVAGVNPMINLSSKGDDYVKLKRYDCYAELGVGCDFYLPFFKLRPELKFSYSLIDALDKNHINELKDKNMRTYTGSVESAHTKLISLTFYFE